MHKQLCGDLIWTLTQMSLGESDPVKSPVSIRFFFVHICKYQNRISNSNILKYCIHCRNLGIQGNTNFLWILRQTLQNANKIIKKCFLDISPYFEFLQEAYFQRYVLNVLNLYIHANYFNSFTLKRQKELK